MSARARWTLCAVAASFALCALVACVVAERRVERFHPLPSWDEATYGFSGGLFRRAAADGDWDAFRRYTQRQTEKPFLHGWLVALSPACLDARPDYVADVGGSVESGGVAVQVFRRRR